MRTGPSLGKAKRERGYGTTPPTGIAAGVNKAGGNERATSAQGQSLCTSFMAAPADRLPLLPFAGP